jgi:hypothetical protein
MVIISMVSSKGTAVSQSGGETCCQQFLEYVEAQLRVLNGKDLFQSNQSNIATDVAGVA